MKRREFLISAMASGTAFAAGDETLATRDARVTVGPAGSLTGFNYRGAELLPAKFRGAHLKVTAGGRTVVCKHPLGAHREGDRLILEYRPEDPAGMTIRSEFQLRQLAGDMVALRQTVRIEFAQQTTADVALQIPIATQLPVEQRHVFAPMKNGIGRRKRNHGLQNDDEYVFRFAGAVYGWKPQELAIPMIDEWGPGTDVHVTYCADPYFGSHFRLPFEDRPGRFHCIYTGGRTTSEKAVERTLYTVLHRGSFENCMSAFYATSLAGVKPGPEWMHDVAMVGYDYLSENGQGWFADIDTLTRLIEPRDRAKVFLALHGWYDFCGRYTFDVRRQFLDKTWVAMSQARAPQFQALGVTESEEPYAWWKPHIERMRPVPMSIGDMHRRIRYAKDRGFRVGLYFADGTIAGDGLPDFDPSRVLHWGGWQGPDTKGKSYSQNPLHPDVHGFFTRYISALLEEYGKVVDGFVWDETYTVKGGEVGPNVMPGYAGVAMMRLVQECASAVASYSPNLAFFTSDDIGFRSETLGFQDSERMVPYCLMAHGTYQDSQSHPEAWPYGLIPNYRNVLWSCNWAPVRLAQMIRHGVEMFDAPMSIAHAAVGDDVGISEMTADQVRQTMELFEKRKHRPMRIGWIEEEGGEYRYQGRVIRYKYSL